MHGHKLRVRVDSHGGATIPERAKHNRCLGIRDFACASGARRFDAVSNVMRTYLLLSVRIIGGVLDLISRSTHAACAAWPLKGSSMHCAWHAAMWATYKRLHCPPFECSSTHCSWQVLFSALFAGIRVCLS